MIDEKKDQALAAANEATSKMNVIDINEVDDDFEIDDI